MSGEIKVKLTAGLIVFALLHSISTSILQGTLTPKISEITHREQAIDSDPIQFPRADRLEKLPEPEPAMTAPPVNTSARDEIKRAGGWERDLVSGQSTYIPEQTTAGEKKGGRWVYNPNTGERIWCNDCPNPTITPTYQPPRAPQSQPVYAESELSQVARAYGAVIKQTTSGTYHAVLENPSLVWVATGLRSTHAFFGSLSATANPLIAEMKQGTRFAQQLIGPEPTYVRPSASPVIQPNLAAVSSTLPKAKGFDLALFVANDQRSSDLLRWFDSNEQLRYIKSQCNFQVYTPDNPIYKTRLASVVSVENFPAVVLTFADGGHIHAAAERFLPSSAEKLASDLYYFTTLAKTARDDEKKMGLASQQQNSGALKQTGYSWDKAIAPSMQLYQLPQSGADCVDGNCFPERDQVEGLLDRARAQKDKEALIWMGSSDYLSIGLLCFVLFLAFLFARQRGVI